MISRYIKKEGDMHYVYILQCNDDKPYIGCTKDLKDRLGRHSRGEVPSTAKRLPITLQFYCALLDKYKAFEFEKYLKSGSGRAFVKRHFC